MNFKEWLELQEATISRDLRLAMRKPYSEKELRKNINPGDLVHFGFDTKAGGKKVVRYGIVTYENGRTATVYQFDTNQYKDVPLEHLVYIIFTAIPDSVLFKAQQKLPELFERDQVPNINYHAALRAIQGTRDDDDLKVMPKALIKLTEKQAKRYKGKIPAGGDAPMMSPDEIFAMLTKKEPKPEEDRRVQMILTGHPEMEQPAPGTAARTSELDRIAAIMNQDKPKLKLGGGLADRVKQIRQNTSPRSPDEPPPALNAPWRRRPRPVKQPSLLDRL